MMKKEMNPTELEAVIDHVYSWSRAQGYRGWDKHDGLNSPLLGDLLGWGRWPRMVAIQSLMRIPFNPRKWLGVPKVYNPKGLALFVMGLLDRYRTHQTPEHLAEAEWLLQILLDIRAPGNWSGMCWGYHYPWQDPGFYAPSDTPNAVVTCFVCEAFLDAYRITRNAAYLETVGSVIDFLLTDLTVLKDEPGELCLSYMPMPMTMRVMDVSILIGSLIAEYIALSGEKAHANTAERLVRYVLNRQTAEGAWFYTDPPGDSRIRHDNYHTGFILDCLHRYREATGNRQYDDRYDAGLRFYAEQLFNPDYSPRWMSDVDYPHDIHGAAQGILTFARHNAEYPGLSLHIAQWAIGHLYNPEGKFYYQERKYYTKRFTLLRWCNAWMARALSALLRHGSEPGRQTGTM